MKYLLVLLLAVSIFGFYTPVHAADTIGFDASAIGQNNANFTVGSNANRILLVATCNSTAAVPVTGVTFNSVAMTLLDTASFNSSAGEFKTWYLLAPATGLHAIAFTGGSAFNGQIYSYYNVKQVAPEAHKIGTGSGTSISSAISTVSTNAVVWASTCFTGVAGNTITYSTNQGNNRNPTNGTDIGGVASNANADGGAAGAPSSYTQTQTIGGTHAGDWDMAQIDMGPSGSATFNPAYAFPF